MTQCYIRLKIVLLIFLLYFT